MRLLLIILILVAAAYGYFTKFDPELELLKKIPLVGSLVSQENAQEVFNQALDHQDNPEEAFALFLKAAKLGYPQAQYLVGIKYIKGEGVVPDEEAGVLWVCKAAEQGYAPAQNDLGVYYLQGNGVPQDDAEAVALFRKAAEQGFANAQHALGMMYFIGKDPQQNDQTAALWIEKAAKQGLAKSQLVLGLLRIDGRGVPQDYEEGAQWLSKAMAHQTVDMLELTKLAAPAQKLAIVLDVVGPDSDETASLRRNLKLEIDRFFRALRASGMAQSTEQGRTMSVDELAQLAQQGDPQAQYILGTLYFNGQLVTKDQVIGMAWFRKAASQGNEPAKALIDQILTMAQQGGVEAQRLLGLIALNEGETQNYAEAKAWFEKAASQGDAASLYNLGVMYWKGLGVEKDPDKTLSLWEKAAAQDYTLAKKGLEKIKSMETK